MKREAKNRHPTKKKSKKPTSSHPIISCGKRDRDLLKHLSEITESFNVKQYSRENKIPRSSVYEALGRLEIKGLAKKEQYNNHITEGGKAYIQKLLDTENKGVGRSRQECRDSKNLSTHLHKFTLLIKSKKNFNKDKLKRAGCKLMDNNLRNLKQTFAYFDDATITINPKKVIINISDFHSKDVEDSDSQSFVRVMDYIETLNKCGIELEELSLESGHWARVDDLLANFIYHKVDKKYCLELENGAKLYVDCSNTEGLPERETDDKVVKERVDNFMGQIASNDFDLHDIDKIKESLGFITKLESARLTDVIEENKLKRAQLGEPKIVVDTNIELPSYFG